MQGQHRGAIKKAGDNPAFFVSEQTQLLCAFVFRFAQVLNKHEPRLEASRKESVITNITIASRGCASECATHFQDIDLFLLAHCNYSATKNTLPVRGVCTSFEGSLSRF